MWYTPIEVKAVEHYKKTIADIDEVTQRQERAKKILGLAEKAASVQVMLGGFFAAAAPTDVIIHYNSFGFKEIAAAAGICLGGIILSYFGLRNKQWVRTEEKIAKERQDELLEERMEFIRIKKETEKSPAYSAYVN